MLLAVCGQACSCMQEPLRTCLGRILEVHGVVGSIV